MKRLLGLIGACIVGGLILVALLIGLNRQTVQARTPPPGCAIIDTDITTPTTWALPACYRVVTDTVAVQADAWLTVKPGVEIYFDPGSRLQLNQAAGLTAANGDVITYTIVAVNTGPSVSDITLSNPLPPQLQYVDCAYRRNADPSLDLDCNPNYSTLSDILWQEDFDTGDRITTTLSARVQSELTNWPVQNCATLDWSGGSRWACFTMRILQGVNLVVIKNDNIGPSLPIQFAQPGDPVTYTISMVNTGTLTATNVVLTETLPLHTDYAGTGWTRVNSRTYTLTVGTLPADQGRVYSFVVRVQDPLPDGVNNLVNWVCGWSDEPDSHPDDNCNSEDTPVRSVIPGLALYKYAPSTVCAYDIITYTIVAANDGSLVPGVILTDTVPYGTTYIPGSCTYHRNAGPSQSCDIYPPNLWQEDLATGDRITTTFAVQVTIGSMGWTLENQATLIWGTGQVSASTSTIVTPCQEITLHKYAPSTVCPYDIITYTIVAANDGPPVPGVILTDTVPYGTTYIPGSCTYHRNADPSQSCDIYPPNLWQEDLATGDRITTTFAVQVTIGSMGWTLENQATLIWGTGQVSASTSTIVTPCEEITLHKDGPSSVRPYGVITYTITTANNGPPASGVVLSDPIPGGTVFIPGSCTYRKNANPSQPCNPLPDLWQEDLATGDRITTTFAVRVTIGSMGWPIINCATLTWDSMQVQSCVTTTVAESMIYLPLVMRNFTQQQASLTLVASPMALVVGETAVITATALDQYGAPIAGMPVSFFTSDPLGSGALTPLDLVTNASGQVVATLRSTLVGVVRVTADASNGTSDSVTLVFRSTTFCALQLWAIPDTGPEPRGIALDTTGRRAFIAHAEGITVIDADDFAVITEIRSLASAHGIAYDPDNNHIWVTTRDGTGRVRVLDGVTYAIAADLPAGNLPHAAAYNPANGRVYVTNYGGDTVGVYSATSMTLERTLTGFREPAHVAANPVTNKVYVTNHRPNGGVTVIDGVTHGRHLISTALIDAYGVAVDTTRNLVYVTAIDQGRISVIDGAADSQIGSVDIRRGTGETVPLRVIAVNPDVGPEGHLIVVTSSEDRGQDQLLLIPNGWPTLGTPVPLNITSYPQEGIALDRTTDFVWATSVSSGQVNVARDGLPVCSIPFLLNAEVGEEIPFQIEKLTVP